MHQRTLTLLPAAAFLVALVPQLTLAPPGPRPLGRTLPATAAQATAMQWRPYPRTASVGQLAPTTARG